MTDVQPVDTVAFVDDDEALRAANLQTLALAGLRAAPFAGAEAALAAIDRDFPGIVVSDVRMPGMDGLQLFRTLRAMDAELPVILVTGHGDVAMAVAALKDGAWDFLTKPFGSDALIASVRRALETRRLVLENRRLRAAAAEAESEVLIGRSPAMERLRETIRQLALADVDVMIEGETGTGKELAAVLLHRQSARRGQPFVALNCGALPVHLAESELFGHQDGAVPGARLSRVGRIAGAHRGSLFLDELDSMPEPLQVRLLRVLEEREVTPIGGDQPIGIDIRVIAAIKQDPAALIASGRLRQDLYYRLNVVKLRMPPLRERAEDIPLLFAHFAQEEADRQGTDARMITDGAIRHLQDHDWPGNVRELRHFARSFALGLDPSSVYAPAEATRRPLRERTQAFEMAAIRQALQHSGGDVQQTLDRLGIPRKTFYDKLARYGIVPSAYRRPRS
jgi:two-component system C4-dicarboxylate transport response regulator DctD